MQVYLFTEHLLNEDKPLADITDFERSQYKDVSLKPSLPATTAN